MSDLQGWAWHSSESLRAAIDQRVGDVEVVVPARAVWRHDTLGVTATLDVDVWDHLVVDRVELVAHREQSPDGITHEAMRLPLARMARASVLGGPIHLDGAEAHGAEDGREAGRHLAQSRRRRRITPDFLERVAEVYNGHPGADPRQAVADLFDVSPSQASNYVRMARERGLIEPTRQGRPTHTRASSDEQEG